MEMCDHTPINKRAIHFVRSFYVYIEEDDFDVTFNVMMIFSLKDMVLQAYPNYVLGFFQHIMKLIIRPWWIFLGKKIKIFFHFLGRLSKVEYYPLWDTVNLIQVYK